jgi:DNA-binding response OmpR family regulator
MVAMADSAARRCVLLVEDEPSIRELVTLHLSLGGFDVTAVGDGSRGLELARATPFDLVVLDLMLPGLDGVTVCRAVRADGANRNTPLLMLTARDTESDKVIGLESGADDYLTKPFGVRELMARVTALLRRGLHAPAAQNDPKAGRRVVRGDLVIDPDRREAVVRGEVVGLTKQEFDLLHLLASRPGIVFSRAALMANVWSGDTYVTERTVDTVVSRLRRKVEEDPQDPALLLTAWGVGYKFADIE